MACALMQDQSSGSARIVGLEWHNGRERYSQAGIPALAICFSNGTLQLMKDEMDDTCMVINTGLQPSAMQWNSSGSVLAVAGSLSSGATGDSQGMAVVQFYTCTGEATRAAVAACQLSQPDHDTGACHISLYLCSA